MYMEQANENNIEFLKNEKRATVFFSQGRFITRIKELAKSKPDEVQIVDENKDGTIVAHIPVDYIRINPTREYTDEQLLELRERCLNNFHAPTVEGVIDSDSDETGVGEEL